MADTVRQREVGGMFSATDLLRLVGSQGQDSLYGVFRRRFRSISWTGSGRGAIRVALSHATENGFRRILLPSYLCASVAAAVEASGLEIAYYSITDGLRIDAEHIREVATPQTLVFVIEYFGWPTADDVLASCARSLLVDVSHSISSHRLRQLSERDCMVVASLRKIYPLPDGGVFACNSDTKAPILLPDSPESNLESMVLKSMYETNQGVCKDLFLEASRAYEEGLDKHCIEPYSMSAMSREAIEHIPVDSGAAVRSDNYRRLSQQLGGLSKVRPLYPELPDQVIPLCMPLVCDNREMLKTWLISRGIYPPVHWVLPETISGSGYHFAHRLSAREISLPCDSRYGKVEMDFVAQAVLAWHEAQGAGGTDGKNRSA